MQTPTIEPGQQLLGIKRGFHANETMRTDYLRRGGGKAKAVELISLLHARGGRTTIELCRELEVPHRKLAAIVDIARKFTQAHENSDIRAMRDPANGRLWFYWVIYDPEGLLGRALDNIQRALAHMGSARKIMDVLSAFSLEGDTGRAAELVNQLVRGFDGAASEVMRQVDPLLPGAVRQSRLNAQPPSYLELGVPGEGAVIMPSGPEDIWDIARRRASA